MESPRLFIFIGYPGAGKTTISKIIAEQTGAKHLWADVERHRLFPNPTHSPQESAELYERLNEATDYLLKQGKSVVFDTNFNFFVDREKLREIAKQNNAQTVLIWVNTPERIAKERSVKTKQSRNLYSMNMSSDQFDSIVSKMEKPKEKESAVIIDGSNLDKQTVLDQLNLKPH